MRRRATLKVGIAVCLAATALPMWAAEAMVPTADPNAERIEITATRIPEDVETVPGSMTIITGEAMRARGATDLRGALLLAAGIDIAPGGDGGPASSVPELWGLKEFDAFLLVVDGVPWGGAFVPALATLDLSDVERIEILRGPAPVMYGATSFVGVIHVIHTPPGVGGTAVEAGGGSYGTGSLYGRTELPAWGPVRSSVGGGLDRLGFQEDRTQSERGRLSWRGSVPFDSGAQLRLQANGIWMRQDPGSPHPRVGAQLSSDVPVGSNQNPGDAHLNEQRVQLAAGFDRPAEPGLWSSLVSVSGSAQNALRGFLTDVTASAPNAVGFREDTDLTDIYIDTHFTFTKLAKWKGVAGIDELIGHGFAHGGDFDYFVNLDGSHAPNGDDLPSQSDVRIRDERNFSGMYGQIEWLPTERWRFQLGARLNRTAETRTVRQEEFAGPTVTETTDSRTVLRGSGSAGATWTAWQNGPSATWLYANYSETYKPAAIDFGIDSEGEILEPETATSYQGGVKSRVAGGAVEMEASLFQMDFDNLVVSQSSNGLPTLVNAGKERFRGAELEADWRIRGDLLCRAAYSLHDARFRDFVTEFGGVPTQLSGNRIEMSARNMAAVGVVFSPNRGWVGSTEINYIGSRFLNKRNTALAPAYTTWSAGVGYKGDGWRLRLDAANLNNRRPPVSESELGDAQYYLLPARRVTLSLSWTPR